MFAVIACVLVLRVLVCIPPTKIHICGSLFECASAHCIGKLMSGELRQEKIPLICCSKHPEGSRHVESNAKTKKKKERALEFIQKVKARLYSKDHPVGAHQKSTTNCHIPWRNRKGDKLSHYLAGNKEKQIVALLGGTRRGDKLSHVLARLPF